MAPGQRYLSSAGRVRAVLDTSFWVAAYRAEVAANGFDSFDLIVPRAVEAEILAPHTGHPRREYPYATLFRQLRHRMSDPPGEVPPPLAMFGPGEAAAITLAETLPAVLLINEQRAAVYARNLGIPIVTVPAFVVTLRGLDIISDRAARRKLELIAPITAEGFLVQARELLDALNVAHT